MPEYYANACIICSARKSLKRFTRCQMISYCGQSHQKEHWPNHKNLCKVISTMMKEMGVSHVFEKLKGTDMLTWRRERMKISVEAERRLRTRFEMNIRYIFKFPRACFVCYESRQNLLTNCPGCPSASFCRDHSSSSIHDKDCAIIRKCFEDCLTVDKYDPTTLQIVMSAFLISTRVPKCSNRPASMRDYLFEFAVPKKPVFNISEKLTLYLSGIFSLSLTIFSALQKLDYPSVSELTIHAGHIDVPIELAVNWETLLHLVPDLKILRILVVDYSYPVEDYDKDVKLCSTCRSSGKKLTVYYEPIPYGMYIKLDIPENKPDILVYSNLTVPEKDDCFVQMASWLKDWPKLNCPLILTFFSEMDNKLIKKTLLSLFRDIEMCFDGENPFRSLFYFRTYEDGGIGASNHSMIIMKPRDTQKSLDVLQRTKSKEIPTIKEKLDKIDKFSKITEKLPPNIFYASACQVCHSTNPAVTCNRCKMIFYCGRAHRSEDQSQHKELCKVILGMLNESGMPNLFDKRKTTDSELWLRSKIDLLTKAKLKLGRKLLDYEEEMFLYPKTCFVCHESDLSVLKNCECGELKVLKIVFIGPQTLDLPPDQETRLEFQDSKLIGKSLKVESHALRYDEYFKSASFNNPNIVVGFNLHIHESTLGISESTWKDTIRTLKKVEAPFILTAGSEERAHKDNETFCELLGKSIDYVCCIRNPFASLVPERDFETERLRYSNKHVIIYNNFYES